MTGSIQRPEFVTVRTCEVEVQYLRGQNAGREGFWIVDTCHAEQLSSTSFQSGGSIPTALERVASHVLSWSDSRREGITGKGGKVRKIGGDADSALFVVTARVEASKACAKEGAA